MKELCFVPHNALGLVKLLQHWEKDSPLPVWILYNRKKRYSPRFIQNKKKLLESMRGNPDLLIEILPSGDITHDDLCNPCNKIGGCLELLSGQDKERALTKDYLCLRDLALTEPSYTVRDLTARWQALAKTIGSF